MFHRLKALGSQLTGVAREVPEFAVTEVTRRLDRLADALERRGDAEKADAVVLPRPGEGRE